MGLKEIIQETGAPGWQRNDGYYPRPNPKTAFWMIHVKDSRYYHWAKFGLLISWIMKYIYIYNIYIYTVKIDHVHIEIYDIIYS